MRYLLDTNIFIQALAGHPEEKSFLSKAIAGDNICISVVVIGEFFSKISELEAHEKFTTLMDRFEILAIDRDVALSAAEYRKASPKTKRVQLLDCFLAAQAKLYNLTLVTNNKPDFPMQDIKIISL